MAIHMSRTNIDIDDELIHRVIARHHLTTKREAVDSPCARSRASP
ncbi:MAG: type II toxin-antitoxin system VapB family antitoxin [bacterium]